MVTIIVRDHAQVVPRLTITKASRDFENVRRLVDAVCLAEMCGHVLLVEYDEIHDTLSFSVMPEEITEEAE